MAWAAHFKRPPARFFSCSQNSLFEYDAGIAIVVVSVHV